jgi:hypothetical protein
MGEIPGQNLRNRVRRTLRWKSGPGVKEVRQDQVLGPVPFLTCAKGPHLGVVL